MSEKTWYTVMCMSCNPIQWREFDSKQTRNDWAVNHESITGHGVRFGSTTTAPANRPNVNCAVCVQLGTTSPASHQVYGSLTCDAHVVPMQIAGARGFANAMDRILLAVIVAESTRPLGKQED